MKTLTDEQITERVQADIQAVHAKGITIDMRTYGVEISDRGRYILDRDLPRHRPKCAVCAIGASLLYKKHIRYAYFSHDFARLMGRSEKWGEGFRDGSDSDSGKITWDAGEEYTAGFNLALGIAKWVRAEKRAERL